MNDVKMCLECGKEFRHSTAKCCSLRCSNILNGRKRRGIPIKKPYKNCSICKFCHVMLNEDNITIYVCNWNFYSGEGLAHCVNPKCHCKNFNESEDKS